MLIQTYSRSMIRQTDTVLAAAGRLKNIEKLAYAKSSSVAASGDYLLVDSTKWRVVPRGTFSGRQHTRKSGVFKQIHITKQNGRSKC